MRYLIVDMDFGVYRTDEITFSELEAADCDELVIMDTRLSKEYRGGSWNTIDIWGN